MAAKNEQELILAIDMLREGRHSLSPRTEEYLLKIAFGREGFISLESREKALECVQRLSADSKIADKVSLASQAVQNDIVRSLSLAKSDIMVNRYLLQIESLPLSEADLTPGLRAALNVYCGTHSAMTFCPKPDRYAVGSGDANEAALNARLEEFRSKNPPGANDRYHHEVSLGWGHLKVKKVYE
jgi:hypothetical protein